MTDFSFLGELCLVECERKTLQENNESETLDSPLVTHDHLIQMR